jgi:hypothetical protein
MSEVSTLTGHNPADRQLPEGWVEVELSGVVHSDPHSLAIGPFGSNLKVSDYRSSGVPLVFVRDIRARNFELGDVFVDQSKAKELHAHVVRGADILVTKMGDPPGDVAIYPMTRQQAVITADCIKITVDPTKVSNRYLSLVIESPDGANQILEMTGGVAQQKINLRKFRRFAVPLPPLAEQERIVEILEEQLSHLDAALKSVRVVREKAAQFRRSLLHAAFTGTLTGHNPADGQLPEGWASIPIGTLCSNGDFFDGDWVESKDQDPNGGVRLTQLADIGEGNFRNRSDRWLRDDQAEHLNVSFLQEGDLLIARMPDPLGRCCALPKLEHQSVTVVDVAVLRIRSESILSTFVMWILNSPIVRRRMVELASGTTRQRISRKNLSTIELPIPPLAEQERAVEILEGQLSRLDAALAVADAIEKRSAALRRSLLHAAFTGRLTEKWRESVHV